MKLFRLALLFIIFLEILSFIGQLYPAVNTLVFFVIVFFALILSLEKLEYGLYILLAELFIGSKGYLFSLEIGGVLLSIRIALFLVIMGVWLWKVIAKYLQQFKIKAGALEQTDGIKFSDYQYGTSLFNPYFALFLFIVWGLIWGLVRGNSFDNVFFDFNGWLYFLLIFPLATLIRHRPAMQIKGESKIDNIFRIFTACIVVLGLKTLFLFYAFAHNWMVGLPKLYSWIRNTGVGEITQMNANFYRIFFQGHIYSLIGFFVFLSLLIFSNSQDAACNKTTSPRKLHITSYALQIALLCLISSLSILISFSRSFWVGGLAGLAVLFCWIGIKARKPLAKKLIQNYYYDVQWSRIVKLSGFLILLFILEIGFIRGLINFPKPKNSRVDFASMVEKRVATSTGEAAGKSRINLLKPLFQKIAKHPIIGSGFGTTVTYRSTDPRALERNLEGWYTTYAFEWGYLDIWLKIGLPGLLVYLYLIWKIFQKGWKIMLNIRYQMLSLGILLGLIAFFVTNIFSPYLNHPLGIGYILLCSVIFQELYANSFANNQISL